MRRGGSPAVCMARSTHATRLQTRRPLLLVLSHGSSGSIVHVMQYRTAARQSLSRSADQEAYMYAKVHLQLILPLYVALQCSKIYTQLHAINCCMLPVCVPNQLHGCFKKGKMITSFKPDFKLWRKHCCRQANSWWPSVGHGSQQLKMLLHLTVI